MQAIFKPYTFVDGIDTVAVPHFNVDLLGHSEFAGAEAILHDMFELTRMNLAPKDRQRIQSYDEGGPYLLANEKVGSHQ